MEDSNSQLSQSTFPILDQLNPSRKPHYGDLSDERIARTLTNLEDNHPTLLALAKRGETTRVLAILATLPCEQPLSPNWRVKEIGQRLRRFGSVPLRRIRATRQDEVE